MLRTALSPKWLGLLALVVAVMVGFGLLGRWQFDVAQEKGLAEATGAAAAKPMAPLTEVIRPGAAFPSDGLDRKVRAEGEYVASQQVLITGRKLGDQVGYWVVTPLRVAGSHGPGAVSYTHLDVYKRQFEEIVDTCQVARYYAHTARRHLRPRRHVGLLPGCTPVSELRHPKGVVGIVAPWNYPLSMGITDGLPALMAGNAVVVRPDTQTSLTLLYCAELLARAGLPQRVLQVVLGLSLIHI